MGQKKQSAEIKFSPNPAGLQFQIEGDIPVNLLMKYMEEWDIFKPGIYFNCYISSGIPAGLLNVLIYF